MNITISQAKTIIDSIPGDTVVWNCWSANDMLAAANECETAEELVTMIVDLEESQADSFLGAQDWGDSETDARLDAMIEASKARLASLRKRIAAVVEANVG